MEIFPQFDLNPPTQLWIAARYMESISLLVAPLLLIDTRAGNVKEYAEPVEKEKFFWRVFFLYAGITAACIRRSLFSEIFPTVISKVLDLLRLRSQVNI